MPAMPVADISQQIGYVSPLLHIHAHSMALDKALGDRKQHIAREAQNAGLPVQAMAAATQLQPGEVGSPTALTMALQSRMASVVQHLPLTATLALSMTPAQAKYLFSCYANAPHVPHHIKKIPLSEVFDVPKLLTTLFTILSGKYSQLLEYFDVRHFDRWTTPQDYDKFFSSQLPRLLKTLGFMHLDTFTLPVLALNKSWQDNVVWGEQFLSGPNPTLIRKVDRAEAVQLLVDFFPLRAGFSAQDRVNRVQELVRMTIRGGGTLDYSQLLDRLYVVDHAMLLKCSPVRSLNAKGDRAYVHAPMTLLFATPSGSDRAQEGRLAPLAIWVRQCLGPLALASALEAKPTAERLFYPDSPPSVWMFAKMCAGNADANQHELVAHLGFTHLLTEAIAIASQRTFAGQGFGDGLIHEGQVNEDPNKDHPVFRLLLPHFHRTLMINEQGRGTLMTPGPGGLFSLDQVTSLGVAEGVALIDSSFETMEWDVQVNMKANLASRGFAADEPGQLSRFYYRDFGYIVWDAMQRYVELALQRGYADHDREQSEAERDALVADDRLLQKWCDCTRGPLNTLQGNVPTFPKSIGTFSQLVTLCTSIIWCASAQHAAVNFSQYDYVSLVRLTSHTDTLRCPTRPSNDCYLCRSASLLSTPSLPIGRSFCGSQCPTAAPLALERPSTRCG